MRASFWRAPEASLQSLACDRRQRCHGPIAAAGVVLAYALMTPNRTTGLLSPAHSSAQAEWNRDARALDARTLLVAEHAVRGAFRFAEATLL